MNKISERDQQIAQLLAKRSRVFAELEYQAQRQRPEFEPHATHFKQLSAEIEQLQKAGA